MNLRFAICRWPFAPARNVLNILVFFAICACGLACSGENKSVVRGQSLEIPDKTPEDKIIVGAERVAMYYPLLKGKQVALTVNHTSRIGEKHLVDSLIELGVSIHTVFAPEHGFRGTVDAGSHIEDQKDPHTGIAIKSLYGTNRKPGNVDLAGVEVMIFDIQDVGVRFYTYISTMHYVMEGCAEAGIPVIILDRPNPNGHYVDGPILDPDFRSFVGMHEIPVVHGLTVGELAQMINGEGWLENGMQCDLTVVPCKNYDHTKKYAPPVAPSPNLPNLRSILLYPSICLFEPTPVSVGRGTDKQFQVLGHPALSGEFQFTPEPKPGAQNPKLLDELCHGEFLDFSVDEIREWQKIDLRWLVKFHQELTREGIEFFKSPGFFDKLAGGDELRGQLGDGLTADEIRMSWEPALNRFLELRGQYLLYR